VGNRYKKDLRSSYKLKTKSSEAAWLSALPPHCQEGSGASSPIDFGFLSPLAKVLVVMVALVVVVVYSFIESSEKPH